MNVVLRNYSPNPDATIAAAAKVCYSKRSVDDIYNKLLANPEENAEFISNLVEMKHESPLEHVSFTFSIEGVSRSLTHQLVRHRIASYSQRSQRYIEETDFGFVTPKTISNNPEALEVYNATMAVIRSAYSKLKELKIDNEDARFVLPNACETTIIVTMNARTLLNFFGHRCCMRAQWEIREMAEIMLEEVKKVAPLIFMHAGANCDMLGYCPENKKTCHRKPTLNELIEGYKASLNK